MECRLSSEIFYLNGIMRRVMIYFRDAATQTYQCRQKNYISGFITFGETQFTCSSHFTNCQVKLGWVNFLGLVFPFFFSYQ